MARTQDLIGEGEERERDPKFWLDIALRYAKPGSRHTWALFLACRLVEQGGLSKGQALAYIEDYVNAVPGGGSEYSLQDALACLDWAAQYT